jgi:hypothetical protein
VQLAERAAMGGRRVDLMLLRAAPTKDHGASA